MSTRSFLTALSTQAALSSSSSGYNACMGLRSCRWLERSILQARILPSLPGNVCRTRHNLHIWRGALSPPRRTISPSLMLLPLPGLVTCAERSCRRYACRHCRQEESTRAVRCLYLRICPSAVDISAVTSRRGGKLVSRQPTRKCAGVKSIGSPASDETKANGFDVSYCTVDLRALIAKYV